MKFTFLVKFLAKRQKKSKRHHDKYVHFVWGYFMNLIIMVLAITFFNQWIGLAFSLLLVLGLEYVQKLNGGTNSFKEQVADVIAGFITAPVWAWLLPYVLS